MNKYIIVALVITILAMAGVTKLYLNERAERIRHEENYSQLQEFSETKISQLKLTQKEFRKQMSDSTKRLVDSLKIKPKRIVKYIRTVHTDIDTVKVVTESVQVNDTSFMFRDKSGCFLIEGRTDISLNIPTTTITHKEHINTSRHFLYKGKRKNKFLFFRVGKRMMKLRVVPECGEETIEVIEVIKE